MIWATRPLSYLSLLVVLMLSPHAAWSALDPEDQKLIDEASCEEIQREYRNYSAAEREVEAEIRKSNAGTAAANVAGIAAFAVLGFGFFTWNDNSDARETLAELREIRVAIAAGAKKKGCAL
jgi:TRAP-type C4-dicarboxylate transport system substrate-binding protein